MLVDAVSVAFRSLSFIALFQAAGMAIFVAIFGRDLAVSEQAVRRIGSWSALVAVVFVLGHYALEAARMSGGFGGVADPVLQGMVMDSPMSVALTWRLVGLVLIAIGLYVGGTRGITLALLGAALALAAFAHLGHTAAHAQRWLLSVLLLVHLFVVAFWFGALLPLYLASSREVAESAGKVVEGFSSLAFWLVPALFLAGVVLVTLLLPSVSALLQPYGRLILAKVAGFAVLMLLASLNKWRLGPALARGEKTAAVAFRRSLLAEYLLIAAVLAITAALTTFYSPEG